jgi:hypothetical protein
MGGFAPQIQAPQSQQTGNINGINEISQGDGQQDDLQKFLTGLTGLAGGKITLPSQQGQPQMGMPNAYENTIPPYNQQQPEPSTGKGNLTNNQFAQNAIGKGV